MNLLLLTPLLLALADILTIQLLLLLAHLTSNPTLEYYGRALASFTALALSALYGTLTSAFLNIFGYGGLGQWTTARCFKWMMWFFAGVWME
ncbi:1-acylglycerol-3-phosphate O-acyltransferase, partial [Friedmanniomyces endolithicus]